MHVFDFDAFRRPPADLHERGTVSGFVLTVVSFAVFLAIVIWHLVAFWFWPTSSTEMVVRQFRKDRVKVNMVLDIAMPCPLIDLEVHDVFGTHTLDAARSMRKQRIESGGADVAEGREVVNGPDGSSVSVKMHHVEFNDKLSSGTRVHSNYYDTEGHSQLDSLGADGMQAVVAMANSGEWCRFNGTVAVAKMPGRLFIRAHHLHLSKAVGRDKMKSEWYNTSHVFRRMNFLDSDAADSANTMGMLFGSLGNPLASQHFGAELGLMSAMMSFFSFKNSVAPLDLTHRIMSEPRTNWRYDLQVVGHIRKAYEETYDYTMGAYSYHAPEAKHEDDDAAHKNFVIRHGNHEPLSISYSFSPITIVHKETFQSIFVLARNLLSTLGGCFVLLKLLDNSVFFSRHAAAKYREGKMS